MTEAPKDEHELVQSERWWQRYTGRREQASDAQRRQFAPIENEECRAQRSMKVDAADVSLRRVDEGVSRRRRSILRKKTSIAGVRRRSSTRDRDAG